MVKWAWALHILIYWIIFTIPGAHTGAHILASQVRISGLSCIRFTPCKSFAWKNKVKIKGTQSMKLCASKALCNLDESQKKKRSSLNLDCISQFLNVSSVYFRRDRRTWALPESKSLGHECNALESKLAEVVSLSKHVFPFIPTNIIITGSKSGEYEELRERMYTKLLGNGTLLLQHVKEDREGFYLCQASNGIGSGIGKVIQLRVNCEYYESSKFIWYK